MTEGSRSSQHGLRPPFARPHPGPQGRRCPGPSLGSKRGCRSGLSRDPAPSPPSWLDCVGWELGGGEAPTRGRGSCAGKEAGHQGRGLPAQRQTPGRCPSLKPQVLPAAGRGLVGPLGVRAALLSSCAELCCSVPAFPVWASPPSPWQPGIYSLAPMNSPVLDAPQEQSHSCDLLCPASFAQHPAVKVHPCEGLSPCQHFLPVAASSSRGATLGLSVRGVCCGHCLGVMSAVAVTTFVCGRASLFSGCPPGVELVPHTDPLRSRVLSPAYFIAWACARLLFLHTLTDTCRLRCSFISSFDLRAHPSRRYSQVTTFKLLEFILSVKSCPKSYPQ